MSNIQIQYSYKYRKENNLCTACGKIRDNEFEKCNSCRDNWKMRYRIKAKNLFDNNQCLKCKEPKEDKFLSYCNLCLEKMRDKRKAKNELNGIKSRTQFNADKILTELVIDSNALSYVAGFFDGEGTVSIKGVGKEHRLIASISNTDYEIIKYIHDLFNNYGYIHKYELGDRKDIYNLLYTDNVAYVFLIKIYPYLRIKKERALLAIEFRQTKKSFLGGTIGIPKGRHTRIPPEEIQKREGYRQKMLKLNKRGK